MRAGLDLGSSYLKVVAGPGPGRITLRRAAAAVLDYRQALAGLGVGDLLDSGRAVLTGYGKESLGGTLRNEVACLARAWERAGYGDGTLVDIGGQDIKVLRFRAGKLTQYRFNRRCAAGTGSFIETLCHRLRLSARRLNALAAEAADAKPLNSFCTVFAATEVLDRVQRGEALSALARGAYASVAARVREVGELEPPVRLCGGFAAHHPVFREVFAEGGGPEAVPVPHPKYFAAWGAFCLAWEEGRGD